MESQQPDAAIHCWDAVIIGAGPASAAIAIVLAQKGWRVLIAEKQGKPAGKLGESLPPAAVGLVQSLIGSLTDTTLQRFGLGKTRGNIASWQSAEPELRDFFFTAQGYGLNVDRRRFDIQLLALAQQAGARLIMGRTLLECWHHPPGSAGKTQWTLILRNRNNNVHEQHRATYLVDASGRHSAVAKLLDIKRDRYDQLFAFCQRYVTDRPDQEPCTRLEATAQGWWYSNVLPPRATDADTRERTVVFHTDRDLAAVKQAGTGKGFASLLAQCRHLPALLARHGYRPRGKVRGASAASERLHSFAGPGWMAVGDAAQAYDPLSSQGIGKALTSGSEAGQLLHYALDLAAGNRAEEHAIFQRYATGQEQLWHTYQEQYRYYYQSQPRWPDQLFWQRRGQQAGVSATHLVRELP